MPQQESATWHKSAQPPISTGVWKPLLLHMSIRSSVVPEGVCLAYHCCDILLSWCSFCHTRSCVQACLCLERPCWQACTSATGVDGSSQSGRDCFTVVSVFWRCFWLLLSTVLWYIRLLFYAILKVVCWILAVLSVAETAQWLGRWKSEEEGQGLSVCKSKGVAFTGYSMILGICPSLVPSPASAKLAAVCVQGGLCVILDLPSPEGVIWEQALHYVIKISEASQHTVDSADKGHPEFGMPP